MKATRRWKVGVVGGARGVSQSHLSAYRFLDRADIAAICDSDALNGRRVAAEHGAIFTDDFEEMLSLPGLDIVDVCSPDPLHCPQVVAAARAGKHILCEKPMAMTLAQAAEMRTAVESNGVTFMVGMTMRWKPWHMRLRELIRTGTIGRPVFARYQLTGCFFPYPRDSFYRRRESLGQLFHNGPHYLDALCDLLEAAPVDVYGVTTSHVNETHCLETPNYHFAGIGMDGGQIVEIEYNQLLIDPPWPGLNSRVLIVGDEGTLEWADKDSRGVRICRGGGEFSCGTPPAALGDGCDFVGEISHFLDCVETGIAPAIPIELSIKVLAACLGAIESAATGNVVGIA
jgi:predicted dehydrogenase